MERLVLGPVYIKVYWNNNDSNFILYMGPDSNFKGPAEKAFI